MSFVPPVFVSHGSPTLAIDEDRGQDLAWWARDLPRPRSILVISAHWQTSTPTRGSTSSHPPLIYDFSGFPDALRQVKYPAPGAPDLAYELHSLLPVDRAPDRGWDHGVWTPLVHMFPSADIPLLQLSLPLGATPRALYAIGRKIGVLCDRGYLVMGSGSMTHNLGEIDADPNAPPRAWAREFDGWVANVLADSEMDRLLGWRTSAPHARRAHPTSEHLDPLFVAAGAASLYGHAVGFPVRGFEHGTISRRCVQFGTTATSRASRPA
jgi:4,5-DOPA dioxygenase extradiol